MNELLYSPALMEALGRVVLEAYLEVDKVGRGLFSTRALIQLSLQPEEMRHLEKTTQCEWTGSHSEVHDHY